MRLILTAKNLALWLSAFFILLQFQTRKFADVEQARSGNHILIIENIF